MRMISKMVLRMYAPAALLIAGGLVAAEAIKRLQLLEPPTAARLASLAFLLAIVLALAWASQASWRLYRWQHDLEQRCECGGLLSRTRLDRRGRKYRKCLACGGKEYLPTS